MPETFGERMIRWRWAVVAAWAVLVGAGMFIPSTARLTQQLEATLPDDAPAARAIAALKHYFPQSAGLSQAVIVFERTAPGDPAGSEPTTAGAGPATHPAALTKQDMSAIAAFAQRLGRPLPPDLAQQCVGSCLMIHSPTDFPSILQPNPLISPDGQAAVIFVEIPSNFISIFSIQVVDHIDQLLRSSPLPEGLRAAVTGSAGYGHDYALATQRSTDRTLKVTLVLVLVVLLIVYRAPLAAAVVLGAISLSAVAAMQALAAGQWLGLHVGLPERIFVFVLLYGVGVDYSLLYLSRYREILRQDPGQANAPAQALSATATTMLASAMTNVIGLAMLITANFPVFRSSGKVLSIALVMPMLASLTLIPALTAILGPRLFWPVAAARAWSGGIWYRLASTVTGHPRPVLAITILVLCIPAALGLRIHYVYDALTGLAPSYRAVVGMEMTRRHWPVGELGPVSVLLEAQNPAGKAQLAAVAAQLTEKAPTLPGVSEVRSLTSPLGRVPARHATAWAALALLPELQERIRREYLSADGKATYLSVVLTTPPMSLRAMAELEGLKKLTSKLLPPDIKASFAGATAEIADTRAITQRDFRQVAVLVLAAVYLIVLWLLRDAVLATFMVATTVLSYLAALGITWVVFVALVGQAGLDWKVQVFLFVVLVAIGQDYNIFLAARLAQESLRVGPALAARIAAARTGGTISSAGLITACTLGSLMAGDLVLLVQLGFAFAVGILMDTFLVRPLLLPAFAALTGRTGRPGRGLAGH